MALLFTLKKSNTLKNKIEPLIKKIIK
jgi:hypothetical protein